MKILVIGGGIGGLVAALALERAGFEVHVFETARSVKPLGVGINLLPHCVRVLDQLGAMAPLLEIGIQTRELAYFNRLGQRIWGEPRASRQAIAGRRYPSIAANSKRPCWRSCNSAWSHGAFIWGTTSSDSSSGDAIR